jgi:hypothetical protein
VANNIRNVGIITTDPISPPNDQIISMPQHVE